MAEVTGSTEITSEDREFAKEILNHVYNGTLTVTYANDQLVVIAAKIVHESGECSNSMNMVNIVFSLFAGNVQGKVNMLKVLREGGKALRRNGKFYSSCIRLVTSKYRTEVEMNL
ncbi:hypothetical protein [Zooshikella ganghwensis]|uniref:Uncharacterized protein n=1 Tax=Zooshikella ganghwensis TaxID=202772 RepID=A0A4P9VT74_9GAMM|nr:hypothetical protein [Zooshikella ganghwensis]RDH46366.1 hypothetical protein B9G39_24550 [Zooshikella ganghwensis]